MIYFRAGCCMGPNNNSTETDDNQGLSHFGTVSIFWYLFKNFSRNTFLQKKKTFENITIIIMLTILIRFNNSCEVKLVRNVECKVLS